MKKVVVLMGGMSSERDISLQSGAGVLKALEKSGYIAVPLDLTSDLQALVSQLKIEKPDVVFNALHGRFGEDGCIQGVLNILKIPYTHSGVLASSIAMNKSMCKRFVQTFGISVAEECFVSKEGLKGEGAPFSFPFVIKPNDEGSSVGVFILHNQKELDELLEHWPFSKPVLAETYISGRELSVAVTDQEALGCVEIIPEKGFYDYRQKYATVGGARHIIPAQIDSEDYKEALRQALMIHKQLGCRGVSRTDFRYDETRKKSERLIFLEINTNPGMTSVSLVPDIAKTKSISYEQLVVKLVEQARCDD